MSTAGLPEAMTSDGSGDDAPMLVEVRPTTEVDFAEELNSLDGSRSRVPITIITGMIVWH